MPDQTTVLFVCLGNICRSPLAQGIFQHLVNQNNLTNHYKIDSCGTASYHTGNPPDPRSIQTAALHNIDITQQRARQFNPKSDIEQFDYIIPMDTQNKHDLIKAAAPKQKLHLMRSFDPTTTAPDIPDPYYGGDGGFEQVYQMLTLACQGLLDHCDS